jgi:hypothetical protein
MAGTFDAIPAGDLNMPLPMVDPTRTAIALINPSFLGKRGP